MLSLLSLSPTPAAAAVGFLPLVDLVVNVLIIQPRGEGEKGVYCGGRGRLRVTAKTNRFNMIL